MNGEAMWRAIRKMRATPPGRAAIDESRREVFAAGLEQAEQFFQAAQVVGFETKPLQLFYALSQAGRAITAAHAGEPWQITGHGASVEARGQLNDVVVEPHKRGALPLVAATTGSESWEGAVALGALWASLPELPYDRNLCDGAPPALALERDDFPDMHALGHATPVQGGIITRAGLRLGRRFSTPEDERRAVVDALAPYPRAKGWGINGGWINSQESGPVPVSLSWVHEEGEQKVITAVEELTEEWNGTPYLRPGLGSSAAVPSPLVTWWGVLLALSSLARYEPVIWREALDIDGSPTAHALEEGLLMASSRLPELIVQALSAS